MVSVRLAPLLLVGLCALPRIARAQQTDAVAAEALFDSARDLMQQGNYAAACPKLAESERLDPGIGTLLNLGECYDKNNQPSRAWETFREAAAAAAQAKDPNRERYAQTRATELGKRLLRVIIAVPPEARVPGLQVLRDGAFLTEPLWSVAVPIDPGPHSIEARAPGYSSFRSSFEVTVAAVNTITIPKLERDPSADVPAPNPLASPSPSPNPSPSPLPSPSPSPNPDVPTVGSGQRTVGVVVMVVGVVSLGTGAVFGGLAMSKDSTAKSGGCDKTTCPDSSSLIAASDAQTYARVSTWTFALGGVALVGGLALWLTAPKAATKVTAWISPTTSGGAFGGSF